MDCVRVVPIVLFLWLTACASTTVNTRLALEPTKSATLKLAGVEVATAAPTLPPDVADRLKAAVTARLTQLPQGATPVQIRLTITDYRVASAVDRFMAGLFVGSNRMGVDVKLTDEQGNLVAHFDVARSANSGAYGALMDEKEAIIQASADGVAEGLGAAKTE